MHLKRHRYQILNDHPQWTRNHNQTNIKRTGLHHQSMASCKNCRHKCHLKWDCLLVFPFRNLHWPQLLDIHTLMNFNKARSLKDSLRSDLQRNKIVIINHQHLFFLQNKTRIHPQYHNIRSWSKFLLNQVSQNYTLFTSFQDIFYIKLLLECLFWTLIYVYLQALFVKCQWLNESLMISLTKYSLQFY